MANAAYLYLFFEDYMMENGNPYDKLKQAKIQIYQDFQRKYTAQKKAGSTRTETEQKFEELYGLSEGGAAFANLGVQSALDYSNLVMADFDDAINELINLFKIRGEVTEAVNESNKAIQAIDEILTMGAKTGGLANGAIDIVKGQEQKLSNIAAELGKLTGANIGFRNVKKAQMIKDLESIRSGVSGYLLEIAVAFAFGVASKKGLEEINQTMINIGGGKDASISGYKDFMAIHPDPKIAADLQKITNIITHRRDQPGADLVMNFSEGGVSATDNWLGFQAKNYSDIGSIPINTHIPLGNIPITKYYSPHYLVNVAGTLAGDQYRATKIPASRRHYKEALATQTEVAVLWSEIVNSVGILAFFDGLVDAIKTNFTDQNQYYVIRSKDLKQIRVIHKSKLVNMIFSSNKIQNFDDKFINFASQMQERGAGNTKGISEDRQRLWSINVQAFTPSDPTGRTRSAKAYQQILNKILETKINIAINFNMAF